MTATEKVLQQVRDLPEAERMEVVMTISHELADAADARLTEEEHEHIESVLADRIDGPFEPLPSREEFHKRVEAEVARLDSHDNNA